MKILIPVIYWLPRILCILTIGFILLLGADSFDPALPLQDQLIGFMMHSIPGICLILMLVAAWKWELWGGVFFMAVGLVFTPFIFSMNYHRLEKFHNPDPAWISVGIVMTITFPFILAGALFVWSHFLRRKISEQRTTYSEQ
jgi:hypothetical protein